jgi:hypothetical protein
MFTATVREELLDYEYRRDSLKVNYTIRFAENDFREYGESY